MGLIATVLLAILAVIAAALARLFADEFKAWTPWLLDRLVRRAIAKLPDDLKDRCDEEWRSHLNETPGELGKLVIAIGYSIAANRICYGPWTVGRVLKRATDISFVVSALLVWAPLILLLAFFIKLDSKGPVIFKQKYGFANRTFNLFRLRTTHVGFERDPNNPRVTRVGRFLRHSSLDELPQLFNILRGDMTLVGPRPYSPRERRPNSDPTVHRHLKPGMVPSLAPVWLNLKVLLRRMGKKRDPER
jgi:hypothetical protein